LALQQSERCAKALADRAAVREFHDESFDSVTAMTARHLPGLRIPGWICQAEAMAGSRIGYRQRSRTAIIMTRPDPLPAPGTGPPPAPAPRRRDWQWLWWIPLGLLVAAAWALLLFGDSLQAPPP
jgi:hypothetical protein